MSLHPWSAISNVSSLTNSSRNFCIPRSPKNLVSNKPIFFVNPRRPPNSPIRAEFSDQIAQLVHNKVLVAAGVSAAIGQLSKPFTSVILYGKAFDIKAVVQAGGFPSTHSSAVVASATCLALERGFSDSIFGLAVVYAGLVMYDSQGVRREVGIHARVMNKVLKEAPQANGAVDQSPVNSGSLTSGARNTVVVAKAEKTVPMQVQTDIGEALDQRNPVLKESIGHTEVEVIAGALLGFLVSLAVNTIL